MGIYVNPGNRLFKEAVNSPIYVDKSRLIDYTNSVLNTQRKNICTSRPRRFGKSMAADMLSAYYSKGCDSEDIFSKLEISHENKTVSAEDPEQEAKRIEAYRVNLNRHNVIRFDVQRFLFDESHVSVFIKRIQEVVIRELESEYGGCVAMYRIHMDCRAYWNRFTPIRERDLFLLLTSGIVCSGWRKRIRRYRRNILIF